jgi:hypothetical protein
MPVLFARVRYTEFVVFSTKKTASSFKISVACARLHWKRRNSSLRWGNFLPVPHPLTAEQVRDTDVVPEIKKRILELRLQQLQATKQVEH